MRLRVCWCLPHCAQTRYRNEYDKNEDINCNVQAEIHDAMDADTKSID